LRVDKNDFSYMKIQEPAWLRPRSGVLAGSVSSARVIGKTVELKEMIMNLQPTWEEIGAHKERSRRSYALIQSI